MTVKKITFVLLFIIAVFFAFFYRRPRPQTPAIKEYFVGGSRPAAADALNKYRQLGYSAIADLLEKRAAKCFHMVTAQAGKQFSSQIGGVPSFPDNEEWPKYNGKSLAFIAQINLGEIPPDSRNNLIPNKGMLYFFYDAEQSTWGFDPKDKGSWRVIYSEEPPKESSQIRLPADIPEEARYKPVRIQLVPAVSLPDPGDSLSEFSLSEKQEDEIVEIYGQFAEQGGPLHQLLGYPTVIQNDMRLECQLASHGLFCGDDTGYQNPKAKELEAGATEWCLLLQIDSDDEAGMMWGDCGRLYFWITEDDLANRRFENTWMCLQCY